MNQQQNRTNTSTQIRNMYSDGMSYMNIKFYNSNLSFQLYPFIQRDQNGRSKYDKQGQQTTVNYEGAFAIYQACKEIVDGKIQEMNMTVPCASGASLTLERKLGMNGQMETVFSITKNNITIPFRFQTIICQVKENGNIVTKVIESGIGAFMKTIEGYLTGINADRHLDKLTDDYVKQIQSNQGTDQQPQQQQQGQNNFRKNNNYRRYNNNNNRSFNGNNSYQQQQPPAWGNQSQGMSTYQLPQ